MLKYDISFIYKKVTELLHEYDKPYKIRSDDPSVNIRKIAQNGFGVEIKYISPWPYRKKHAVINSDNGTVYIILNEKDRNDEARCRFSIAHELGHLVFSHIAVPIDAAYRIFKYNIAHEWIRLFYSVPVKTAKNPQINYLLKSRYNSFVKQAVKDLQIPAVELTHLFKPSSVKTETPPEMLNYNIAHEWGRIVYNNDYYCKDLTARSTPDATRHISSNPVSKISRLLFIKKWGREELADHFAANLLVPIYRFQHYLEKSDKELVDYFKVDEQCIKKRRNEFKHEMYALTATKHEHGMNDITAAVKPLSIEEIVDPDMKHYDEILVTD